jgi:hypothetical protein
LIGNFLYTNVGDHLLLQIALHHQDVASYSSLCKNSGPKPLQRQQTIAAGITAIAVLSSNKSYDIACRVMIVVEMEGNDSTIATGRV